MFQDKLFSKYPELKELLSQFRHELQNAQRPAEEVVLDDEAVMKMLNISKRKLQYLKADRIIPFHTIDAGSPRTYYILSDILELLKENRIDSISNNTRIK